MSTLYNGEYVQYNGVPITVSQFTISILSSSAFNSISSVSSGLSGASNTSILGPEQIVLVGSNDGTNWYGITIVSGLTTIWGYLLSAGYPPLITFNVSSSNFYSYYRLICVSLSPQTFSTNTRNSSVALASFTLVDTNQTSYPVFPSPSTPTPTTPAPRPTPTPLPTTLPPSSTPIPQPNPNYASFTTYSGASGSILTYSGSTSIIASTAPSPTTAPSITYQGEYFQYTNRDGSSVSLSNYFKLGQLSLGILPPSTFNSIVSSTINTGLYNASANSILGPDQIVTLGSNDGTNWIGISSEANLTSKWTSVPTSSANSFIPTVYITIPNPTAYLYYRIVFPRLAPQSFSSTPGSSNSGIVLTNLNFMDAYSNTFYPVYPQSTTTPIGSSLTYIQYNNYPNTGSVRIYNGTSSSLATFAPVTTTATISNVVNTSPTIPPTPAPTAGPSSSPSTSPGPSSSPSPTVEPTSPSYTPAPTPIVYPTSPPFSTIPPLGPTTPPASTPSAPITTPSPTPLSLQPTPSPGPTSGPILSPALVTDISIAIILLSIIGLLFILLHKPKEKPV